MAMVRYGVNKDVKKPEAASKLSETANKHIKDVKNLDHVAKLTGDKYGKAPVRIDGQSNRN